MVTNEQTVTIEDEDGFITRWPWPEDKSLLGNGSFIAIYEQWHNELKQEALASPP